MNLFTLFFSPFVLIVLILMNISDRRIQSNAILLMEKSRELDSLNERIREIKKPREEKTK